MDIVQVYRGAIVVAFAAERPDVVTPEWRKQVFAAFEPSGIATLLDDEVVLQKFLSSCGMPVGLVLDADRLSAAGLVELEVDVGTVIDEWFLAVNGVSRSDHQAALAAAKARFEQYGLKIIGRTTSGDLVSLI